MKKILIATDGSPACREATAFGLELAQEHAAEVTFLHVVPVLDRAAAAGIGFPAAVPHGSTRSTAGRSRTRSRSQPSRTPTRRSSCSPASPWTRSSRTPTRWTPT